MRVLIDSITSGYDWNPVNRQVRGRPERTLASTREAYLVRRWLSLRIVLSPRDSGLLNVTFEPDCPKAAPPLQRSALCDITPRINEEIRHIGTDLQFVGT